MHLFGLTGGIASGKSAVAARLRERGVPVIDADKLARDAVAPGTDGLAAIVKRFGAEVLLPDGSLDRKKLGAIVFGDEEKRKALNAIVHPQVTLLTFAASKAYRDEGEALVAYEAALIVENGVADAFRPLVVVAAPEAVQLARIVQRDGLTEEEARARIAAQMPLAEKIATADYVIENTGSLADLERRTDEVLASLCERLDVDADRYE
ncbi:MAG: dephospho-CoA kinase [Labilithrix sp.]|nr:dephospho-CoA kinase [Labilithrix sp.]MCW5817403.1 dephospho-CoA kinase [Labilithrix sp.]